jgi:putative DNA primase/helicase
VPAADPAWTAAGAAMDEDLTDDGNAQRLVARHGGGMLWCPPWKEWLLWNGVRWLPDEAGLAVERHLETVREVQRAGLATPEGELRDLVVDWALKSKAAERCNAALRLARSKPGIPVTPDDLDRHAFLLNCANGTVDLTTGVLRAHRREDILTKLCPTPSIPDAPCAKWLRFLELVFDRNLDIIRFLQRWFGYCRTGDVSEQVLLILWGAGANGKSTLLRVIMEIMGSDYALKANQDLLMVHQHERHPTEIAQLDVIGSKE